jgi:glycosyltransferase involved in cell wall biosynthesis
LAQKEITVVVVGTSIPFPVGIAATNRIISYLKLMVSNGLICKVLITKATEKKGQVVNQSTYGTVEGINYRYLSRSTVLPGKGKRIVKIKNFIYSQLLLISELIQHRPTVVITYSYSFSVKLLLIFAARIFKFRLFFEETEYPKILKRKRTNWMKKIYLKQYKYADGMIVMTKTLHDYYSSLGVKQIFHLPMTVDSSRFSGYAEPRAKKKEFVYAGGSGGFKRDGVLNIVQAFLMFQRAYRDYRLVIAGPIDRNDSVFKSIQGCIIKNEVEESVVFTGNLKSDEIPGLLMHATGIIMAPPKDFESGGFPTKLGEFLASGTPTICTRVSDIEFYIAENEAFLAKPDNIGELVEHMTFIAGNPSESMVTGFSGAQKARKIFNAETYISKMIGFVTSGAYLN